MGKDDMRLSDSVCGKLIQAIAEMSEAMKQMDELIYIQKQEIDQLRKAHWNVITDEELRAGTDDAGSH